MSPVTEWRLQLCMAHAGIRFASDLHKQLQLVLGADAPSEAHISRLVRSPPERLNLTTLAGLCHVLRCTPGDLLHVANPAPTRRD